jgi:hypothetical protein
MNIIQPLNTKVLSYLTHGGDYMFRRNPEVPVLASWNSVPNAYTECGCHPDIVERIWDNIGIALPIDCRGLIHSNPALVQPKSGVILSIGLGTWYGLRLPGLLATEAIRAGAKTSIKWSTGKSMDIQHELGEDWFFGSFLSDELIWCKKVYEMFDYAT